VSTAEPSATAFDPAWVQQIRDSAPLLGGVRLVCIDGPAGSGKTSLARELAAALTADVAVPVVHGDEVYEGWPVVAAAPDRITAFDLLADRVDSWLLDPWRHARPGRHPVWDWHAGTWGPELAVAAAPVVILEGVALASARLRSQAVLSIWVEAAPEVALARVLARDGDEIRDRMLQWQVDESRWHALDSTRDGVDVRVRSD
jgi:uridine kinase